MKLSTLRKKAQASTKWRGHKMRWVKVPADAKFQSGRCLRCDAACWLDTHPAPNSTGISGLAVAVNCSVN